MSSPLVFPLFPHFFWWYDLLFTRLSFWTLPVLQTLVSGEKVKAKAQAEVLIRNSTPPIPIVIRTPPPSPFREGKIQTSWMAKYSFPGENFKTPSFDGWLLDWATYKWQNTDAKAVKWKATARFRQVRSRHFKGMPSIRVVWGGGSKLERPNI